MIRSTCSDEDTIALISQGRSEDGATPLHLAALAGNSDVIRFLLVTIGDQYHSCRYDEYLRFIEIYLKKDIS